MRETVVARAEVVDAMGGEGEGEAEVDDSVPVKEQAKMAVDRGRRSAGERWTGGDRRGVQEESGLSGLHCRIAEHSEPSRFRPQQEWRK